MRKTASLRKPPRLHNVPELRPCPDGLQEGRSTGMVEVRTGQSGDVVQALADAVEVVAEAADRYLMGIMITEIGTGNYTVRAHPAVPHGLVREQRG